MKKFTKRRALHSLRVAPPSMTALWSATAAHVVRVRLFIHKDDVFAGQRRGWKDWVGTFMVSRAYVYWVVAKTAQNTLINPRSEIEAKLFYSPRRIIGLCAFIVRPGHWPRPVMVATRPQHAARTR